MMVIVVALFIFPLLEKHWDFGYVIKVKIFLFIAIIQKYVYVILECFSLMLILSLLRGLYFLLGVIVYIFPQNWKKSLAVILQIYFLSTLTFLLLTYKLTPLVLSNWSFSVRIWINWARRWAVFNVCFICSCQRYQIPAMAIPVFPLPLVLTEHSTLVTVCVPQLFEL